MRSVDCSSSLLPLSPDLCSRVSSSLARLAAHCYHRPSPPTPSCAGPPTVTNTGPSPSPLGNIQLTMETNMQTSSSHGRCHDCGGFSGGPYSVRIGEEGCRVE